MRPATSLFSSALLLAVGAVAILRPLAAFWNDHDAYFFGWGVPFLAFYLLYERWQRRPSPRPVPALSHANIRLLAFLLPWALLLLATRLMLETVPESRPVLWLNASLLVAALLAWFGLAGGPSWTRHFAFPVAFLFLSVPWIFRWEFDLTQGLMRLNAGWVTDTLVLLDVPARAAGNTIVLADGQLGVSEACSGIRSLQATLMMSLFFGEFYRFPLLRRVLLPFLGASLALAGNYARLLFLAWKGARDGMATVEADHDPAGLLILLFTVVALWLLCLGLRQKRPEARLERVHALAAPLAFRWAVAVVMVASLSEGATQAWYRWREASIVRAPGWTVAWPTGSAGFHPMTIPAAAHEQLHDDASSAASWRDEEGWDWTGTWFHFPARAANKDIFSAHNPGLCLTAAGWGETGNADLFPLCIGRLLLDVRRYRFESSNKTCFVYWLPYVDRGVNSSGDQAGRFYGHALAALLRLKFPALADVWHGCRGAEAETLEITVTGPVSVEEADRGFREVAPSLIRPEPAGIAVARGP